MMEEKIGSSPFDDYYLELFRKALWQITDREKLIEIIPNSRFRGYIDLLNYLFNYTKEEIDDIIAEYDSSDDLEDRAYLKRELDLSKMRLEVFNYLIEEFRLEEEKQEEYGITPGRRQIVYLHSKAGNCLVESDMEDLTVEELDDMKEAFEILKNDESLADPRKYKTLTNDRNLRGIRETKCFQSRIYFYHLEKDIVIAILALGKKGDNPKRERERLIKRAQALYDNLDEIKKILADPEKREEFLGDAREITERIDGILDSKKVGKR